MRALVVEDAPATAELVRTALEVEGFAVQHAPDLASARAKLQSQQFDVMVLDVELPDGSGLDLLREHRAGGADVPVVILSGRKGEVDRVVGLELGAEDYVVKPFFPRELATRVRRAAGRRPSPNLASRLVYDDLVIDLSAQEVLLRGEPIALTTREFALLAHLAASPRTVFGRNELLRDVWGSSPEWQTPRTVTEHIRRLRLKLEVDPSEPRRIVTVGRSGYRFDG